MTLRRGTFASLAIALVVIACGSSDEAAGPTDPSNGCRDTCKAAGFSGATIDPQANQTNCFCLGAGTLPAGACPDLCKSIGKTNGKPLRSNSATDNGCQCT